MGMTKEQDLNRRGPPFTSLESKAHRGKKRKAGENLMIFKENRHEQKKIPISTLIFSFLGTFC